MANSPIRVVFATGGTAGHMTPGLAVAEALKKDNRRNAVLFVGPGSEVDRSLARSAGIRYQTIPSHPSPHGMRQAWSALRSNLEGVFASRGILRDFSPDVAIGLGGFGSFPVGIAATLTKTPLILMEQNAVCGRANRWLSRWAHSVCLSFESAAAMVSPKARIHCTGNPLRSAFIQCEPRSPSNTILVLGGSQGSAELNQLVPRMMGELAQYLENWKIVHQAGPRHLELTKAAYLHARVQAEVLPFIADPASCLQQSSLVIARAGGSTLAEICAAGVASILIPYPHAAEEHQRYNARTLAQTGGCLVVDSKQEGAPREIELLNHLTLAVKNLVTDSSLRDRLSAKCKQLSRPDAAAEIVEIARGVALAQSRRRRKLSRVFSARIGSQILVPLPRIVRLKKTAA